MPKADCARRWADKGAFEQWKPWGFAPSCLMLTRLQISCSHSLRNSWSSLLRWAVKMAWGRTSFLSGHSLSPSSLNRCTCLCCCDWRWLVCFTAATSHLHVLPAGMMAWKGLVCSSLHLVGYWTSTSCMCRGVTGQLGFTASVGCSGLLSQCRSDCGTIWISNF